MSTSSSQWLDQSDRIRRQINELNDALTQEGKSYKLPTDVMNEIEVALKARKESREKALEAERTIRGARAILLGEISLLVYRYLHGVSAERNIFETLWLKMKRFLVEEQFVEWLLRCSGFVRQRKAQLLDFYMAFKELRTRPGVEYQWAIENTFKPFLPHLMTMFTTDTDSDEFES